MRFYLGQTFRSERAGRGQLALVVALEGDGQRAKLRVFGTNEEFAADWADFHRHSSWQRVLYSDEE